MRKALFSLAIFCFPLILNAQTHDAVPRLEAGLQLVFADLGPVRPVGGTGGRFHYNFNDHYALDTEITYQQQDVSPAGNFLAPAVTLGQTNVFAGLRAGFREQNVGAFFRVRGGDLRFGSAHGAQLLSRRHIPALDNRHHSRTLQWSHDSANRSRRVGHVRGQRHRTHRFPAITDAARHASEFLLWSRRGHSLLSSAA